MEFVNVSLHQQGNPVRIPLKAGRKLSKSTLSSQFSGSTGLKYFQDGWNAVECNEEDFLIPNHINDFVVVTEHTGNNTVLGINDLCYLVFQIEILKDQSMSFYIAVLILFLYIRIE